MSYSSDSNIDSDADATLSSPDSAVESGSGGTLISLLNGFITNNSIDQRVRQTPVSPTSAVEAGSGGEEISNLDGFILNNAMHRKARHTPVAPDSVVESGSGGSEISKKSGYITDGRIHRGGILSLSEPPLGVMKGKDNPDSSDTLNQNVIFTGLPNATLEGLTEL